jgi:hypothetical protein
VLLFKQDEIIDNFKKRFFNSDRPIEVVKDQRRSIVRHSQQREDIKEFNDTELFK